MLPWLGYSVWQSWWDVPPWSHYLYKSFLVVERFSYLSWRKQIIMLRLPEERAKCQGVEDSLRNIKVAVAESQ